MRVYFSHTIRGMDGPSADQDTLNTNCTSAILMAGAIMKELDWVDFYVPAEHEDFVQKAYDAGYITEEEILAIDCKIIDDCDACAVSVSGDEYWGLSDNDRDCLQGGRLIEYDHCIATNKPVLLFCDADDAIAGLKALKTILVPKG